MRPSDVISTDRVEFSDGTWNRELCDTASAIRLVVEEARRRIVTPISTPSTMTYEDIGDESWIRLDRELLARQPAELQGTDSDYKARAVPWALPSDPDLNAERAPLLLGSRFALAQVNIRVAARAGAPPERWTAQRAFGRSQAERILHFGYVQGDDLLVAVALVPLPTEQLRS